MKRGRRILAVFLMMVVLSVILCGGICPGMILTVSATEMAEEGDEGLTEQEKAEKAEQELQQQVYAMPVESNGWENWPQGPGTYGEAAIVMEVGTGAILYAKNIDDHHYPASITKVLTALVALENGINAKIRVKNVGYHAGKEVVQLYVSMSDGKTERAEQELKGFEKTRLLKPGQEECVCIHIPWDEFAYYDEKASEWLIEKGNYQIRMGNFSRQTVCICEIDVTEDIVVSVCSPALGLKACNVGKLSFLQKDMLSRSERANNVCSTGNEEKQVQKLVVSQNDVKVEKKKSKCERTITDLTDFSNEQLAALLVGYGPGIPFAGLLDTEFAETICDKNDRPLTSNDHPVGHNGYVSPAIEEKGIQSIFYMDGPAGIGRTVWPTEMLLACAFNREVWYRFGDAVAGECEEAQIDVWLAPAVNLHRNPLCGRNFEYFSEDPFLTGICACEVAIGVQKNHPVLVCPKHFAVNEQETYRRGSAGKQYDAVDSVITERAARELYLKPFEMLVRKANVHCMMTSFNKINGKFTGGNCDLCNRILRDEWGYDGFLVTDWGDMDVVVDGADAVAAGNDVVMPGGPPVIEQILKGYQEGRVTRGQMEKAVQHLLHTIEILKQRKWKNEKENV